MAGDPCPRPECGGQCPGWDMFETSKGDLEIESCDHCGRFPSDRSAWAHLIWLVAQAFNDPKKLAHLVRLMGSGGTAREWEELSL